jgi:hypothetical protein
MQGKTRREYRGSSMQRPLLETAMSCAERRKLFPKENFQRSWRELKNENQQGGQGVSPGFPPFPFYPPSESESGKKPTMDFSNATPRDKGFLVFFHPNLPVSVL